MVIEVNTNSLIENSLTASQYIALHLLFEQKYATYTLWIETYDLHKEMEGLVGKYIYNYDKKTRPESIAYNKAAVQALLKLEDSGFWDLLSRYPIKVPDRNGGARYLRPASMTADMNQKLKMKYDRIVSKSKHKHEHIMRCLEAELWFRKKGNSLQFMRSLEVWLNRREWQNYEHLIEMSNSIKTTKTDKYGEDLV